MIPTCRTSIRGYGANIAWPGLTTLRSSRPNQFTPSEKRWLAVIARDNSSTWPSPPFSPTTAAMMIANTPWTSVKMP